MTQDEQQQVNAAFSFLENQLLFATRNGCNAVSRIAELEQKLKAAEEKIKELSFKETSE